MSRILTCSGRVIIWHFNSDACTVLTDSPYLLNNFNNIWKMFKNIYQEHLVNGVIGKGVGVYIHIMNNIDMARLYSINSDKPFDFMSAATEV